MKSTKLIIYCLAFVIAFASTPAFSSDVVTNEKTKITIGYCPYGMLETSVMKEKKFYQKYMPNVEVEWFFGLYSVHLINNWVAGKLEFAYLGNMPSIMLQGKMKNTKWVGNAVYTKGEAGAMTVPKGSTVKNIKDLNGKTVATGIGSSHHRLLEVVQEKEGIKFNIVNQAPEVAIGNLEAGKLDGFAYWPPYIDMTTHRGIGTLVPPGNFKQYEPYVNAIWPIVVSESFAKKHPEIVKAFVKADQDLHKFMKERPDEAAQIVFKETEGKIPLEVLKGSLARYGYASNINKEQIDVMQADIDFLHSRGYLKDHFKAADWADTSFSK
ncbi:MAG: transporter substrate-binding protein [Thermodesulfobacteriota bacterium]|nr:transporter substrate-binding protein [Thermodesulfobacteriota bacterium]